ncbi:MAG: endonuclease/exonuclease/phosphatase family protein [Bacteroidales bacterium]|nr:endonuclease/exonuclease/phosphatase family protein [Bacteroidales bacterium]
MHNDKRSFVKLITLFLLLAIPLITFSQKEKQYKVVNIAFYNLENLFDTLDTPDVNDRDYTPEGLNRWDTKKYNEKLENLAEVLSKIGADATPHGPAVIGLAEMENRNVLEDLVKQEAIADRNYRIVHYDSPDRRGIDVALFYQSEYFEVTNSVSHRLNIEGRENFYTRDQLLVSGLLDGEEFHFIVSHWPSRSGGESRSRPLRNAAADLGRHIIDSVLSINPNAKIIYMGDLNDNPDNQSVMKHLRSKPDAKKLEEGDLFNPFYSFYKKGIGTLAWRDTWSLFDMVMPSKSLMEKDFSSYRFYKANVFNKNFLQQKSGRFKGYPLRTHGGGQYLGGYSDHFPTYILLIKEID